ncbi:MAG: hypothetical protein HOG05_10745 [Bacteroidetes bacterium]|nr:hypothetical protein [Bacteroidota bacterium]
MKNRKTITYGIRWTRFILIPIVLGIVLEIIDTDINRFRNFIFFLICLGMFYLLSRFRRLKHDSENFYIIHGTKEKAIHFSSIISIKRSRTKVNGGRFWILTYKEQSGKEHRCRFFSSFNKEFFSQVKNVNPDVIIWTHPFFNH